MAEDSLPIQLDSLAGLAVEHWRLTANLAPVLENASSAGLRHSLRKIEDFLKSCHIETRSLDGSPYDPGLAARVVDTVADPRLTKGSAVILETLAPLVLHRQRVLRAADVVIAANP